MPDLTDRCDIFIPEPNLLFIFLPKVHPAKGRISGKIVCIHQCCSAGFYDFLRLSFDQSASPRTRGNGQTRRPTLIKTNPLFLSLATCDLPSTLLPYFSVACASGSSAQKPVITDISLESPLCVRQMYFFPKHIAQSSQCVHNNKTELLNQTVLLAGTILDPGCKKQVLSGRYISPRGHESCNLQTCQTHPVTPCPFL